MAEDGVLWSLDADGEGSIAVLDEIDAALSQLGESIAAAAESASELTAIDDALATVLSQVDATATGLDQLDASLGQLGEAVATAASEADALTGSLETAATSTDTLATAADTTVTSIATLADSSAAIGDSMVSAVDVAQAQLTLLQNKVLRATEALAEMQAEAEKSGDFSGLDVAQAQLTILQGKVQAATEALVEMTTAETEVGAAAQEAAVETEAMGAAAEESSGMFDGLQAAMGPLIAIGTLAAATGAKIVGMGLDGQKGESLLRGMAGASQEDIQSLQTEAVKLGENMKDASAGFYEVSSAGYAGSDAIQVFDASMKLAEGSGASAQDSMSALTAIMHDYNASADDATHYTDLMDTAVLRGKQSMSDFASAIGPLASAGSNVGISFDQVAAAEATMTQINPHVAQDAQQLTSLFNFLSPTMGGVKKAADDLGLSFDEQKYNSENLLGKLQYLADIAGGTNTSAFVKLTGGVRGSTAAIDLLKNKADAFKGNLEAMGHAAGATQKSFAEYENTIPAHMDKAGAAISVFGTKLMDALGPKVTPIIDKASDAISKVSDYLMTHGDALKATLAGLAAVIGGVLVAAVGSFVIAAAPVIAIILLIGGLVAGAVYAWQHWGEIMHQANQAMKIPAIHEIVLALQNIWSFLVSTFTPVWQQLVDVFNNEIKPAWIDLQKQIQPLLPTLTFVGQIIGAVVVTALVLLVGILAGAISGFAGFLSGLARAFGGLVQIVSGAVQVASGIIAFFVDLTTGHFDRLGKDLGAIWGGILRIFVGVWNVAGGIMDAGIKLVTGFFSGFFNTVVGIAKHLYETLVGHSIIPDTINGIVSWFARLPTWVLKHIELLVLWLVLKFLALQVEVSAKVQELIKQIGDFFGSLPNKALSWGEDMISGFISGIKNQIGNLGNTIADIASTISSHLHFSVPSEGPLSDADKWMPDMMDLFVQGIQGNQGRLKNAVAGLSAQMAQGIAPPTVTTAVVPSSAGTLAPLGGSAAIPLLAGILTAIQQQRQQAPGQAPSVTMYNSNAISGVQNVQDLYNSLNALAGYQFEQGERGLF